MIFENFTKFGPLFRCSNKYKIYLTFFVQLSLYTTLWHRRIWEFLEPKFPQPTQVTEVVYGDGILYGDSKEADEAEEPVIEGLGEEE